MSVNDPAPTSSEIIASESCAIAPYLDAVWVGAGVMSVISLRVGLLRGEQQLDGSSHSNWTPITGSCLLNQRVRKREFQYTRRVQSGGRMPCDIEHGREICAALSRPCFGTPTNP